MSHVERGVVEPAEQIRAGVEPRDRLAGHGIAPVLEALKAARFAGSRRSRSAVKIARPPTELVPPALTLVSPLSRSSRSLEVSSTLSPP
jgi:hypothetical protein